MGPRDSKALPALPLWSTFPRGRGGKARCLRGRWEGHLGRKARLPEDNCSDRPGAPPSTPPPPVAHSLSVCLQCVCRVFQTPSLLGLLGQKGFSCTCLVPRVGTRAGSSPAGRGLSSPRGHDPVFCPPPYPPAPATRWARITTSPMGRPQGNPQETPGKRQSLFHPRSCALAPGFSGATFLSPGGCWLLGALPSPDGAVLQSTAWESRSQACTLA